jgi:hypothetical protein
MASLADEVGELHGDELLEVADHVHVAERATVVQNQALPLAEEGEPIHAHP